MTHDGKTTDAPTRRGVPGAEPQNDTPSAAPGPQPGQSPLATNAPAPASSRAAPSVPLSSRAQSKLDTLATLLQRPSGASLAEMVAATEWQVHSVRGALAGALRKRGHVVTSQKTEEDERRYAIVAPAEGGVE